MHKVLTGTDLKPMEKPFRYSKSATKKGIIPKQRIRFQNGKTVPSYQYQNITYDSGFIFDFWSCGMAQNIHDAKGNTIFAGAYPAGFLQRIKRAFVETFPTDSRKVLHVCAGSIPKEEGIRLDCSDAFKPDILANAESFVDDKFVRPNSFHWALADPPYNKEAARLLYKVPLLRKGKLLEQMLKAVKVGGYCGILDQTTQAGSYDNARRVALIGVTSLPNLDCRLFTVWKKLSN